MADDQIRYDVLVQDALRGVVRKVLSEVARTGLPGDHHFFIAFDTRAPGVRISSRLRERYPEEMTVVIQHQFWDMNVTEHAIEIGLSFSGVPERLLIPFSAIKGMFDPSVKFGLEFEVVREDEGEEAAATTAILPVADNGGPDEQTVADAADKDAAAQPEGDRSASVVSLDKFRKKP